MKKGREVKEGKKKGRNEGRKEKRRKEEWKEKKKEKGWIGKVRNEGRILRKKVGEKQKTK